MQRSRSELYAGTATVDITPVLSPDPADRIELSGYVARIGHAAGIHDALTARALALDDGSARAILVVCDLLGLGPEFAIGVREEIAQVTGAPTGAVMLACTHTHSGPATIKLHECGEISLPYLRSLHPKLITVAAQAVAALQPVTLDTGSADLPEGAYNRRGDGEGIDTEVGIAWLRSLSGETVAILINYGCHPVVMTADNRRISADYPGAAMRALEVDWGGAAFFLTGADGNVDPVRRGSFEDVTWLGEALAEVAGEVIIDLARRTEKPAEVRQPTRLSVELETLELPLQPVLPAEQVLALRTSYREKLTDSGMDRASVRAKVQRAMLAWSEETLAQVARGIAPSAVAAPVQVIRVGRLALIGVPGELFSGLGRQIKNGLPDDCVFIVGYANQDVGYIPDRSAYDRGGYEVTEAYKYYRSPAALAPEAGEATVATSVRLAQDSAK